MYQLPDYLFNFFLLVMFGFMLIFLAPLALKFGIESWRDLMKTIKEGGHEDRHTD